ncbi:MAG TPA: general secretion pathway protein GspB [Woeseiaceae bacterium]|nr:general secretion pathway protein GspB [Woeseiaceae bacterium]
MSFILDALKKSEAERQRKSAPGFADVPGARAPSGTPRWLWAVGGLLAINLAVLVTLLLRPGGQTGPAGLVTQPLERAAPQPAPSVSELVNAARDRRREAAAAASTVPAGGEPIAPAPAPALSPGSTPSRAEPRIDMGSLSTFEQLRAKGMLQLPDLHVDLHVWGERPADRFVVINMNRYKEGATLAEGPRVVEILSTGIVLEHRGTMFFLPSP